MNDVTLFSNGIGHFRRRYDVAAGSPQKISIPFKRDHIGDVAASLQVFGEVRLDLPPSFTPSNSEATSLKIDRDEAFTAILTNLSGAEVKIGSEKYTLLGIETQDCSDQYVVLMDEYGRISQIAQKDVANIEFVDDAVRAEIRKALKANFQQIKPDSTFLDLTLSAKEGKSVEAQVQYTIPVAAWKMRYAIRSKDGKFTLEGAAVIDNNTDEDWDNFTVSVVTGNPISFATDIADVVIPQRRTVRLVEGTVLSNVDIEEAVPMAAMDAVGRSSTRGCYLSKSSLSNRADFGLEAMDASDAYTTSHGPAAEAPGVESREVGDFCIHKSKAPITILARKSAVVPMFSVPISTAGVVLLYQAKKHDRRPYRTVKFKLEADFSLGKGKTIIYQDGVFSGECVLEATKPGENRVLPHCLENGVRIVRDFKPVQQNRASLKISNGLALDEWVSTSRTVYTIENKKNEQFKLLLEHDHQLGKDAVVEFNGVKVEESEKLNEGTRLYFVLEPKQTVTVEAQEHVVNVRRVQLQGSTQWLIGNIVETDKPLGKLAEDKQIQACITTQVEIDDLNSQIGELEEEVEDLNEQTARVRANLTAAKDVATKGSVDNWVSDLSEAEERIRTLKKKEIPGLRAKIKKSQTKLGEELKKITASWSYSSEK